MNKTRINESIQLEKLMVTTEELAAMLSCGEHLAKKVGEDSEARVDLGNRRVFWNVQKVKEYLYQIAY